MNYISGTLLRWGTILKSNVWPDISQKIEIRFLEQKPEYLLLYKTLYYERSNSIMKYMIVRNDTYVNISFSQIMNPYIFLNQEKAVEGNDIAILTLRNLMIEAIVRTKEKWLATCTIVGLLFVDKLLLQKALTLTGDRLYVPILTLSLWSTVAISSLAVSASTLWTFPSLLENEKEKGSFSFPSEIGAYDNIGSIFWGFHQLF